MADQKVAQYEKLSIIYDRVMEQVDYRRWARYVRKLFKITSPPAKRIWDASCGTGSFIDQMNPQKYKIFGSDLSHAMIQQARQKEIGKNRLLICSVTGAPYKSECFDAVVFLYDSFNYLMNKSIAVSALKEMQRVLRPGGILIFDAVTSLHCINYFSDYHENEFWGEQGYYRHSYFLPEISRQVNEFRIIDGAEEFREVHEQQIYEIPEILEMCIEAGLNVYAVFDDFSYIDSDEES
jgi:ubiquinone/menaquinone biosynthesis C-methylase UbiE